MPRRNGSYFGLTVNPTPSSASGIWRVREAEEFLRVNKWPATPGVPGSPVGTAGNEEVSLAWSAPSLGSPPTDYQVQYSDDAGATWTTFADGTSTATSAVVTGLTNGTGYIFRVRAVNALGEGPYGAASGVVTGFNPKSITGLALWLDGSDASFMGPASTGVGTVSDNGPVKFWGDKSGGTFNQTNSGADSVCPTFVRNAQNGRSVVRFDGGDRLSNTSAAVLNPETRTAFIVARRTGGTGEQCYFDRANDFAATVKAAGGYTFYWASGGGNPRTNYVGTFAADNSNSSLAISTFQQNAASGSAWINGVSQSLSTTSSSISATPGAFAVGSVGGSSALLFVGDVAEVLIYTSALSTSQRQAVERYLASKWGITLP